VFYSWLLFIGQTFSLEVFHWLMVGSGQSLGKAASLYRVLESLVLVSQSVC